MSDLVKILVTVVLGVGLLIFAYTRYGSSLFESGSRPVRVTPQYSPVYMPRMR